MGQVVPFIRRVRESADWTAEERARLEALADQLADQGVHVEVIFGATDEGDPWCAVLDDDGEVLIHVARIDGRFVVHSAMDDVLSEGEDLHVVLRERLDAADDLVAQPKSAEIIPFAARPGQTFLALVAAAAFFYETAGLGESAEAAEPPPLFAEPEAPPPPADADAPAQERHLAAQGTALSETPAAQRSAPPAESAPGAPEPIAPRALAEDAEAPALPAAAPEPARAEAAPQPAEAAQTIEGAAGDDLLVGTAADEHLLGGAGNDTLLGGGGHDTLSGGAGDDRIELTPDAVAEGGEGADTFVIAPVAPNPPGVFGPHRLLGVVLDFDFAAGDRIVTAGGRPVLTPPRPPEGWDLDVTDTGIDGPPLPPPPEGFGPATAPPFTRIYVDADGDGQFDGFLWVRHVGGDEDQAIGVVGQSVAASDPIAG